MSKSAKKQPAVATVAAARPSHPGKVEPNGGNANPGSKQSRVISLLRSPAGATIAAMMQATGWQQHSVRGFLAGVVRKRLKLKLGSKKVDGTRVYRVATGDSGKPGARRSRRLSFPKIPSVRIRAVRQNQRIMRCDACHHPPACNVHSRSVQVTHAGLKSRTFFSAISSILL